MAEQRVAGRRGGDPVTIGGDEGNPPPAHGARNGWGHGGSALTRWADGVDGLVIEDDYDAVFRHDKQQVAALKMLSPGRVALVGSRYGLRLGWVVSPLVAGRGSRVACWSRERHLVRASASRPVKATGFARMAPTTLSDRRPTC